MRAAALAARLAPWRRHRQGPGTSPYCRARSRGGPLRPAGGGEEHPPVRRAAIRPAPRPRNSSSTGGGPDSLCSADQRLSAAADMVVVRSVMAISRRPCAAEQQAGRGRRCRRTGRRHCAARPQVARAAQQLLVGFGRVSPSVSVSETPDAADRRRVGFATVRPRRCRIPARSGTPGGLTALSAASSISDPAATLPVACNVAAPGDLMDYSRPSCGCRARCSPCPAAPCRRPPRGRP